MVDKIHIIIPLVAGIVSTVLSIVQRIGITLMCIRLIAIIILFYILGLMVRAILQKIFDDNLCDNLELYDANEDNKETSNDDTTVINA